MLIILYKNELLLALKDISYNMTIITVIFATPEIFTQKNCPSDPLYNNGSSPMVRAPNV